ncbi:hypothetical protein [Kitasatospora sp. NPDC098663]|uniref:HNH endonuclease n=1 Tax=Kitasatospora sp. NPDC098663 TaxID=3364096 RepID=UPI00380B2B2E
MGRTTHSLAELPLMARRKRKTLIVCEECHQDIHAGRATSSTRRRSPESDVR